MTTARNENTTPSFEILEPRVLLDGDVTATLAGSTLVIQGDGQSNAVIIYETATPGEFVVDGIVHNVTGNPTTVNGGGLAVFAGVTSGVKINMGLGDDLLSIGNPVVATTTTIPGNLSIDMGGGTKDSLLIGYDIAGLAYSGDVDILGSLTIMGSDAEDYVAIFGTNVAKKVTMKLGDSPTGKVNTVLMNQNVTTARTSYIGGNLSITGGDGIDTWVIGNTEIMGSAKFKLGDTDADQIDQITIDSSTIHGAVKITGGDGQESIYVDNSTLSSFSAQLKGSDNLFGNGNDPVEFSSTLIVGNVKISANSRYYVGITSNSEVYGNLSIRSKLDASLSIDDSSVTGKVSVSSGAIAPVFLTHAASITGDLALKGKFKSQLGLYHASSIDGNVKFDGGSGQDTFNLTSGCVITGSVKINSRTPQDGDWEELYISGTIGGDLFITGGDGREEIYINGATIDGNLKLDLKDAHVAGIGSNSRVDITGSVFRGDVSIRSKGRIEATLTGSQIDGTFNMKLGKRNDQVDIADCTFFGSFILDTSHGSDTLNIDWTGTVGSNFVGTVTVKMGNDDDNVSVGDIAGVGAGATFQSECFFDGGSGYDWFRALNGAYGNDFQLGLLNYTNFEEVS